MFDNTRLPRRMLVLVLLTVGLAGCQQPLVNYQKTWWQRWTEKIPSWKTPEWEKQQRLQAAPPPSAQPSEIDEKMTAAQMLEYDGKPDRAIGVYEEILRKHNRRGDVHHRVAQLYDIVGQPEQATKHYHAALKEFPKNSDLLCDLGYHYFLNSQPVEAEQTLREAIKVQPAHARSHNNLGLVLAQVGRHEEALGEFMFACGDAATAHVNLAYALMWNERWMDATHHINLALAANPNSQVAQKAQSSIQRIVTAVQQIEQANYALPANPPYQEGAPVSYNSPAAR